jgi:glycosyltransferase involved in cell wall biosynthesis
MHPTLALEFAEDADWLGGAIYLENLLAALSALPPGQRPTVRLNVLGSPATPMAARLRSYPVVAGPSGNTAAGLLRARARRLHRALVRRWPLLGRFSGAPDTVVYFPAFDARQSWRRNLYWIPDFQPLHLPELFTPAELAARRRSFAEIAAARGILLLSSASALADFHRFYPDARVEPRVWSFCSSIEAGPLAELPALRQRYGLPEKFLYIANQFWRHKDHGTAFGALKRLREQGLSVPLVCTGLQSDRRDAGYFAELMNTLGLHTGQPVQLLGVIPRADQIQVLRCAAAVIQPSRFEGWSTVIEDAKALGRPVIASDIAVHGEQLAGCAGSRLFRTGDAAALAAAIAELWPALRPGPDVAGEQRAAARRDARRLESAAGFLAILDAAAGPPAQSTGRTP